MNLTSVYRELVGIPQRKSPRPRNHARADAFIQEGEDVFRELGEAGKALAQSRAAYLADPSSRGAMSEKQKDDVDYGLTRIARACKGRIETMENFEYRRRQRQQGSKWRSFLGPDEAGRTVNEHRDNILRYLKSALSRTIALHMAHQERRMKRYEEKKLSALHRAPIATSAPVVDDTVESNLSSQQLEQLQLENDELLNHFENITDRANALGKTLVEIDALQTEIAQQLLQQSNLTDQLYVDATTSNVKIAEGNVQLQKARERNNRAIRFVCLLIYTVSLMLLFFHWVA